MRRLSLPLAIIVGVVLVDQLTKLWAVDALTRRPSVEVIGDWFMFSLVYNEGGAMGTRLGSPAYYLGAACLILLFLLGYVWKHREDYKQTVPLAFIAGGAIGNIIDRVRIGKVVDFLDVDIPDVSIAGFHLERFWTFNIADAAITCAIIWFVLATLFGSRATEPTGAVDSATRPHPDESLSRTELGCDPSTQKRVEEL